MRTKVYYAGDKSSILEVATAIAQEFKLPAEQLQPAYMPEGLPVVFIGTEDKGGNAHKIALDFASVLDPSRAVAAALFCTSPKKDSACLNALREALKKRGIKVLDEVLVCNGKGGLFGGGKAPDQQDLAAAKAFAQKIMQQAINHQL